MVRAKFYVSKIEQYSSPAGSARVGLSPVMATRKPDGSYLGPCEENKSFASATPSGEIWMMIDNPDAVKYFLIGKEYYVDFNLALPPELTEA